MDTYLKHSRGPWEKHKYDYIDADGNYVYKDGSSGNVTKAPIINPNVRANQNPNVNRNQQATPNQNPTQAPWETNFYNEVNRRLTAHPGLFDTKNFVNADLNSFKLFVKEFGGVDYTKIPDNQLEQMRQKVAAHYAQENSSDWESKFYNEVTKRLTEHPGLFDTKTFVDADINSFKLFLKEFAGVDYTKIPDDQIEQMRKKVAEHYAKENEEKEESEEDKETKKKKETIKKEKKETTKDTNENNDEDKDDKKENKELSDNEINELANRVMRGEFGVGSERKEKLGEYYNEVQNIINQKMRNVRGRSNISNLERKRLEEQQRRSADSDEYKKKKASRRGGGSMFNSDMPDAPYTKGENYLMHFGKPMRSGRYPYGSGKDPFQRITRKLGLRSFFVKKDKKKEEKKDNTESNTITNTHHKTIDASENYEDFQKRLKDDIKNMTDEEIIQRINRINNENRLFELENKRSPYYKVPEKNDRSEKTEESKDNKEEPKKEYDDKLNTSKKQRINDLKNVRTTPTKLLKEKIERLRTEKELRQLTESEITPGKRFVKDVLKESGKKIIVSSLDEIAKQLVKKGLKKAFNDNKDDKKKAKNDKDDKDDKDDKNDKNKEKEFEEVMKSLKNLGNKVDENLNNSPGGLLGLPGPTSSGGKKGKKK